MRGKPFHCADLDPALALGSQRIELTLKWSLLFFRQLVVSETQLLHNPVLQRLLPTPQFAALLESRTWSNTPHIIGSLRSKSVEEIVADQLDIKHGGTNAILLTHQLSSDRLGLMSKLQSKKALTLRKFYSIAPEYKGFVNTVQRMFVDTGLYYIYSVTAGDYSTRVLAAIDSLEQIATAPRISKAAIQIRRALSDVRFRTKVKRSDLWRILDRVRLNAVERDFIGRWALIIPYNRHIAESDGFEMCYSSNLTPRNLSTILGSKSIPEEKQKPWEIASEVFFDVRAIQEIGRLGFEQIARIRERQDFEETLTYFESAMKHGDRREAKNAMREHVRMLDGAIGEQLGVRSQSPSPLALQVLTATGTTILKHKLPILKLLPSSGTFFSRIGDHLWFRLRNPRRRALQIVGESIIRSVHSSPSA